MGWSVRARSGLVALLSVAGSCAPVSQHPLENAGAPYDVAEVERTLAFGYSTILERHLERGTAAVVALEGLRGLSGIDPEISVARQGDFVVLAASDRVVARYPAPGDDDLGGWTRLTVTVALDGRALSPKLRDADAEILYMAVFDATLAKMDIYSRYAGAAEAREHRASRNGYGGVGLSFAVAGGEVRLTDIAPGTPAAAAGLTAGEVLLAIDGKPVPPDAELVNARLRGPVGEPVTLTLRRKDRHVAALDLRRALIVPKSVETSVEGGVARFRVTGFNQRTAADLEAGLASAREQARGNLHGVILDLRGNPGGLLDQAVRMADLFIADGPIVSTRGRHPLASQSYEAREGDMGENLPVVVLIDGRSASAAEILAGALEDAGRAVVVGTSSYGKGTVQTVVRLPNDGEMTLTWSRFYTPSGYALNGLGVLPNLCLTGAKEAPVKTMASATFARWRSAQPEDDSLRRSLRGICPPAKRAGDPEDMAVAMRLLADPAAFGEALAAAAPMGGADWAARRD